MFYGNSGEPAAVGGVFDQPAPSTFNGSIPLSLNQWHHITVTAGGIGSTAKIYVDGMLDISVGQIKNFGPESGSHRQLEIGSEVSSSNHFVGSIDDVRIYNRALTEDEVIALYVEGVEIPVEDQLGNITDEILALVDAGVLNNGQGTSLINYLKNAFKDLGKGKTDGAIRALGHFIGRVNGLIPPLSPDEAQSLIDAANDAIASIQAGATGKRAVVSGQSETPVSYKLEQNYPNPFNPQTTLRFDVPEASVVRLVVYDVLGRQVRVLVDGTREAGTHAVVFEASSLPSGTYLVRPVTPVGSFVQTMQLVN